MSADIELTEAAVKYLDSLEPAERDAYYRTIQQRADRAPLESLESLTERLAELGKNKNQDRAERQKVSAEIDRLRGLLRESKEAIKELLPIVQYILEKGWDEAPPLFGTTFDETKANILGVNVLPKLKEELAQAQADEYIESEDANVDLECNG